MENYVCAVCKDTVAVPLDDGWCFRCRETNTQSACNYELSKIVQRYGVWRVIRAVGDRIALRSARSTVPADAESLDKAAALTYQAAESVRQSELGRG